MTSLSEDKSYVEHEISYDIPISRAEYNGLIDGMSLFDIEEYQQVRISATECIRTGYIKRIDNNAVFFHYRKTVMKVEEPWFLFSARCPLPIALEEKIALETPIANDPGQLTTHELMASQSAIMKKRHFSYVFYNGTRYRLSVLSTCDANNLSEFYFQMECENVDDAKPEVFREQIEWVWETYLLVPPLPALPFSEYTTVFRHLFALDPAKAYRYKIKIDGENFITIYDGKQWISKTKTISSQRMNAALNAKRVAYPAAFTHYVFLMEYVESSGEIWLLDVLFARNYKAFRNVMHHGVVGNGSHKKRQPLIKVDLEDSQRVLDTLSPPPGSSFLINRLRYGVIPQTLPSYSDGVLILRDGVYFKKKTVHTIEVLWRNGKCFSKTGLLTFPFRRLDDLSRFDNVIVELAIHPEHLRFVKVRKDKVIPDAAEKILLLLAAN